MEIEYSDKYAPLFDLLDDNQLLDVDTVIMTGGRASGKSHAVATFSLCGLVNKGWSTLYTRYTSASIVDSVKPEVDDKVELLGYKNIISDTTTHIEHNGNRIAFKGIKAGSKQQTANLKSLSGFNCFIVDEAEELPDLKTFKKVFYSIRACDKRNLSILLLNPTTSEHWIYQEFFEKKGIQGGFNGVIDNVMYIHTSYLDVNQKFIPENIRKDYDRMKEDNPKEYDNIVMGGWIEEPEGLLIPFSKLKWSKRPDDKSTQYRFAVGDPADKGGDKFSVPFIDVSIDETGFRVHVDSVIHSTQGIEANTERIIDRLSEHGTQDLYYESNGVGVAAILMIKKRIGQHRQLKPFASTEHKETRIASHYEFVSKYFTYDRDKYDTDAEYRAFVSDLTSYSLDGENTHRKDAIDVLCSAANFLKIKYKQYLYQK